MIPLQCNALQKKLTYCTKVAPSDTFISRRLALFFSITCGVSVANIYYAQPLLNAIGIEFGLLTASLGVIITYTQIGYGLGLLLLVPLGDVLNRRYLIITHLLLSSVCLVMIGVVSNITLLLIAFTLVGFLAVITQVLVAYAAILAAPSERGHVVGIVTSGIVIGILLARTFSGIIADFLGWRAVYLISAILSILLAIMLSYVLPKKECQNNLYGYGQLLKSVIILWLQAPLLQIRSMIALFTFAAFGTLWTGLVLPLSAPPWLLSYTEIGLFGLVGLIGALSAARAGGIADRGFGQLTTGIALLILILSWYFMTYLNDSLMELLVGIIMLDFAVQAVHVTNQSIIYKVKPKAYSSLIAAYMFFYSIGSAVGAFFTTRIYEAYGWRGVCLLGVSFSAVAFLLWLVSLSARFSKY